MYLISAAACLATCSLLLSAAAKPQFAERSKPLDNVNYAAFVKSATYSIASELGIFEKYGLNVTYMQIPNSTYAYASLADGKYDILNGLIDNVLNQDLNLGKTLVNIAQIDAGPDTAIVAEPGITSILQLKGKAIMVDSPVSGYAYIVRHIMSLYGLQLDVDYTFQIVGGALLRYEYLLNGTFNGSAVYATTLTYPLTVYGELLPKPLNVLARYSDFISPYASSSLTINSLVLRDPKKVDIITRFTSAFLDANRRLCPSNAADKKCAVKAIAEQLNLTTSVAELEYAAATNPISGEASQEQLGNFTISKIGLLNVLGIRQQYGGFPNVSSNFNYIEELTPGPGKIVDYSILEQAIKGVKNVPISC